MNYVPFAWVASDIGQHENCRLVATVFVELYAREDRVVKEYVRQEEK